MRAQFLLDAIADADEVQVGDAELTEYLVRQAARYHMPPQEFANQIVQAGNLPASGGRRPAQQGAGRRCCEQATITDASGQPVDLSALVPRRRPGRARTTRTEPSDE